MEFSISLNVKLKTKNHMKTIRDTFAIQFMSSILSSERFADYAEEEDIMEAIAKDAYKMADKMIEAKGKTATTIKSRQ